MPARSRAQQKAAGAALAAKRGQIAPSALKGAARQMYESMNERQLDEFASTPLAGMPEHVEDGATKRSAAVARKRTAKAKSAPRSKLH